MPEFTYTARTLSGEDVRGTITAGTKRETLALLADRSLYPIHVASADAGSVRFRFKKRVGAAVLASTLTQLADLLENGVPLLNSLEILAEQSAHSTMREVLGDIRDKVSEGTSLDVAFASHPEVFNELTISVVRAGSEGAFLEDALKRTADFLQLQEELKNKVVGAMTYPAFLAVAGFLVTLILVVFFVPKFATLFARVEQQGGGPAGADDHPLGGERFSRPERLARDSRHGVSRRLAVEPDQDPRRAGLFGQVEIAAAGLRPDLSRFGALAILPNPRHAAAKRRADPPRTGNQRGIDRQPDSGRGNHQIG